MEKLEAAGIRPSMLLSDSFLDEKAGIVNICPICNRTDAFGKIKHDRKLHNMEREYRHKLEKEKKVREQKKSNILASMNHKEAKDLRTLFSLGAKVRPTV